VAKHLFSSCLENNPLTTAELILNDSLRALRFSWTVDSSWVISVDHEPSVSYIVSSGCFPLCSSDYFKSHWPQSRVIVVYWWWKIAEAILLHRD